MSTVIVEPESDLAEAIELAAETGGEVRVKIGEESYSFFITRMASSGRERPSTPLPSPSPEEIERSIEGIRKSAGAWRGLVDAEELKAYIRERRMTPGRGGTPPARYDVISIVD